MIVFVKTNLAKILTLETPKLGQNIDSTAYIYIHTYAVELKLVQFLPFLVLKTGPYFFVFENLILPSERRGFFSKKNEEKETKNNF